MNAVVQKQTLPASPEPANLLDAISRAAADPNVDIAKMERLMEMYERIQAKNAERDFNDAMTAAQMEMRPIATDCENNQTHSRYASYAALDRSLRPVYSRHGFAISYNTAKSEQPDHIVVIADVSRSGFTKTFQVNMPNDGKGAKGGDVMTKTHATGAAMSYGMRYLLKMIFNVAVGEDDEDGNEPEDCVSDDQVANLSALISEVNADKAKFLAYLKVKSLAEIPAKNYSAVIKLLEAKRKQS